MGASAAANADTFPAAQDYRLSDDLARLCLPQEFKDSNRNLAWANSICALFLAVGFVGLKAPRVHVRSVVAPTEPPQVVIVQPEELPKPAEIKPPEELEIPDQPQVDVPAVVTVVAAEAPGIKFARTVEVAGAVAVAATPTFASAPPKNDYVPPQKQVVPEATRFTPNSSETEGGYYPKPEYPVFARKNKYQGTSKIEMFVDEAGKVTEVKVMQGSGYSILDDAVVDIVKTRWRFPPGKTRHFWYPFVFTMQ